MIITTVTTKDPGNFIIAPEGVQVTLRTDKTADHGPRKRTITLGVKRGKFQEDYKGHGRTDDSAWKKLVKQHYAEIERDWGIKISELKL